MARCSQSSNRSKRFDGALRMTIKLTRNGVEKGEALVNWNNVLFAKQTASYYGDDYTELQFDDKTLDVKESLDEIDQIILDSNNK